MKLCRPPSFCSTASTNARVAGEAMPAASGLVRGSPCPCARLRAGPAAPAPVASAQWRRSPIAQAAVPSARPLRRVRRLLRGWSGFTEGCPFGAGWYSVTTTLRSLFSPREPLPSPLVRREEAFDSAAEDGHETQHHVRFTTDRGLARAYAPVGQRS